MVAEPSGGATCMTNNPLTGVHYFLRGLGLITKPGLRRFVVVPLIINILLFIGFIFSLFVGTGWLSEQLQSWLPDWLDWLRFALWPLFFLSAVLIMVFCFSIVGNLISAPFNGLLAEAVENHLTGKAQHTDSGWSSISAEIARSIRSELRKLGYVLKWGIPILILLFVPLINAIASIVWLVFGAWMLAIQYADYPMGNHGLAFPEQRELLAQRRMTSLGFGAVIMISMVIPVVNFVVMPASVAGATAMWVEGFAKLPKRSAGTQS